MRKIIIIWGILSVGSVYASTTLVSSESSNVCHDIRMQMQKNHVAIDKAYDAKDAYAMGKYMMTNRQLFESHQECFPPRNRKALIANPQASASK